MPIEPIANLESPATWPSKVKTLIDYWNGETTLSSFGDARAALNLIADDLGLDLLSDGAGAGEQRAKINAMIGSVNETLPADADLYLDFLNGRYYGPTPTDTHATDILAPNAAGVDEVYGPDEIVRNDKGLWSVPTRTNKCTNFNANPTDAQGVAKTGVSEGLLQIVDDSAALAAAGLSTICSNGMVFELENPTGEGQAIASILGSFGDTNPHRLSAFARVLEGEGIITSSVTGNGSQAFSNADYQRIEVTVTPTDAAHNMHIRTNPNSRLRFVLNQNEEKDFSTEPIITSGSQANRTGNLLALENLGEVIAQGVSGVFQMDWLAVESFSKILAFNSTTDDGNRIEFEVGTASGPRWNSTIGGVTQGVGGIAGPETRKTGLITVAFAVSEGFRSLRVVGDPLGQRDDHGKAFPLGLDRMGIAGTGILLGNTTYSLWKRLALWGGPVNQDDMDRAYGVAEEWAAE